jgi:hypothetical protein
MPKSHTSRRNQNQTEYMQQINLHKQKLVAIIIAAVGLIALILPWMSVRAEGFGNINTGGANGFTGWGYLSLLGIIGVVIASLLGDKTKDYDDTFKKVVLGSFGAILVGAIIFFIRLSSQSGQINQFVQVKVNPGIGLILEAIVGLAGLALVSGLVKLNPTTGSSTSSAPPPPPPPKA